MTIAYVERGVLEKEVRVVSSLLQRQQVKIRHSMSG